MMYPEIASAMLFFFFFIQDVIHVCLRVCLLRDQEFSFNKLALPCLIRLVLFVILGFGWHIELLYQSKRVLALYLLTVWSLNALPVPLSILPPRVQKYTC